MCGIKPRTWAKWKERAAEAARYLPKDWHQRPAAELRIIAEDLGIDLSRMKGSGANGALIKLDLEDILFHRAQLYVEFLEHLTAGAEAYAKHTLLKRLDDLSRGGRFLKKKRTVKVFEPVQCTCQRCNCDQEDGVHDELCPVALRGGKEHEARCRGGELVLKQQVELEEDLEQKEDRLATEFLLVTRWPEEFGRRKPISGDEEEASEVARKIAEAVQSMFGTVPEPPPQEKNITPPSEKTLPSVD